jgi:hypothetical protein
MARRLVLVHGYSASAQAFHPVRDMLKQLPGGKQIVDINICNYISLNNEITIKDIAEGFDRALCLQPGLNNGEEFDAIVHSTGMLVVRAWLANYGGPLKDNKRLGRLKHLVGLAPATWGSPQAHKGRTWLGALVKGNRELGPDFLNAGDRVLEGLELGGDFTWDLSSEDLLGEEPYYGTGNDTPYVTVFIGNSPYTGLSSLANSPGCDGTVRWAGCGLNTRKITIDLTRTGVDGQRLQMSKWADNRLDIPIIPVDGRNHATLLSNPDPAMIALVRDFLDVNNKDAHTAWLTRAQQYGTKGMAKMLKNPEPGGILGDVERVLARIDGSAQDADIDGWQQFVVWARDEWGDGVSDFMMEIQRKDEETQQWLRFEEMSMDVHAYGLDESYRCFHIRLPKGIAQQESQLSVCINASTGTELMAYRAYGAGPETVELKEANEPIRLALKDLAASAGTLFYPFTTTMIEIKINRESWPFDQRPPVMNFEDGSAG